MAERRSIDLLELAWAAGFYDGEGSTITQVESRDRRVTLQICVSQCDVGPLERFQRALGGIGAIYGPTPRPKPQWRPLYQFRINRFEHSQAAIAMLWRFLCEPKREQAAEAMQRYHRERSQVYRFKNQQVCRNGHPRDRWTLAAGRTRCLECVRERRYAKSGRETPERLEPGHTIRYPAECLTSSPSSLMLD